MFLYQAAECLFEEYIQQRQLKNESEVNMSSVSSSSIASPCSTSDSASLNKSQTHCSGSQQACDNTSLDNKSNDNNTNKAEENSNHVKIEIVTQEVQSSKDEQGGHRNHVAAMIRSPIHTIGKKKAAAMKAVSSMISRGSNFTRNIFATSSTSQNHSQPKQEDKSTIIIDSAKSSAESTPNLNKQPVNV